MVRPALPLYHANPKIHNIVNSGALPPVKFQILNCQGEDILVGRLKIETPTPTGHAFILRRYDTNAISLTTMFRAAFPTAADEDEKRETAYVKETYNLTGNNGSAKDTSIIRLAGTWVSPNDAARLGREYQLGALINSIVTAKPDPTANYRRSGRNNATPEARNSIPTPPPTATIMTAASINTVSVTTSQPAPAVTSAKPPSRIALKSPSSSIPPAKRRKESSPAPQTQRVSASPAPSRPTRRSARSAKSPQPKATPSPAKTPRRGARAQQTATPGGSDQTVVEEDGDNLGDAVAGSELHKQDVAEQQQMIADLKAQREAILLQASQETVEDAESSDPKLKRSLEETEDKFTFEPKEPEIGERQIATNRRVSGFRGLPPQQKSFAWGVAAFAVGLGAVTFLPNFF
ncbi:hypothetical protein HGRIS_003898 [Hohenbuehelia grisea]|uniref:HTH APSES-type domain-containing protein n=1 Tax=Hohenbuehelia grisea TaxID=104357 RepID=A0ABR3JI03_9AGAR